MIYAVNTRTKEHRPWSASFTPAQYAHEWEVVNADADGWIPWHGGECPLPDGAKCEFRMRRHGNAESVTGAENLRWAHVDRASDIIAYRPLNTAEPEWKNGLPPVNGECEYLYSEGNEWRRGRCVAHYRGQAVIVDTQDYGSECCPPQKVRPLRTAEDKAVEEMLAMVEQSAGMSESSFTSCGPMADAMHALYRAGYRKEESK